MAGAIGDIKQGIVGISHTAGNENAQMPTQTMNKPSPGSKIIVHTESTLVLEDSGDHIMRFIRGDHLDSYSPEEQKELRSSTLEMMEMIKESISETNAESLEKIKTAIALLKNDEILESMASTARNILISA